MLHMQLLPGSTLVGGIILMHFLLFPCALFACVGDFSYADQVSSLRTEAIGLLRQCWQPALLTCPTPGLHSS